MSLTIMFKGFDVPTDVRLLLSRRSNFGPMSFLPPSGKLQNIVRANCCETMPCFKHIQVTLTGNQQEVNSGSLGAISTLNH